MSIPWRSVLVFSVLAGMGFGIASAKAADEPARPAGGSGSSAGELFRRDNLVAWCIVPFDSKKRGPEDRAEMLKRIGFKHFAYDYRAEHVPTFDAEADALKKQGIGFDAWWFPGSLNYEAKKILAVIERHGIHPELWVTGGGAPTKTPEEQQQRVQQEVARLRPIVEAAAKVGCRVGLYNHGGWFGEPENQLAIIEQLKLPNVGIVYNFHHGHDQLDRFPALLKKMLPHLLIVNLNGMVPNGDKVGKKILPLGQGDLDLQLLKTIVESGYRGPIGILGHTSDDAEQRLQDNLDGLDWLVPQLSGKPAGQKPTPRTYRPAAAGNGAAKTTSSTNFTAGFLAEGKAEYRTPPLTVECRATLRGKSNYNILVASDTKQSGQHWELFTFAGSGNLAAYLPGMQPDHARTNFDICDGRPHDVRMIFEPKRVRLFVDNMQAADQAIKSTNKAPVAGNLAFHRLVEGGLGCDGSLESVRIYRGVWQFISEFPSPTATAKREALIGSWDFAKADAPQIDDGSPFKNHAKRVTAATAPAPVKNGAPPEGVHLKATDPNLRVELIERTANEVFMAVKSDTMGRLFVGGREAVFVFEPNDQGGFKPKIELARFPKDSIIIGLEWRGDDLYVLTGNALYLIPEGRIKREGLRPQRILWGIPLDLHISFHCMAWGPDGDLYLNHGDPLLNYGDWTRPDHWGHWTLFAGAEGKPVPYTGVGAVLRMRPDATNVRVVATGLRGPVGLTFDKHGNLFTNDNDHESRADQYAPAKMLHVTPHIDFGWPRSWMASKSPDRWDVIAPLSDSLGRGVPCDLLYYDEPYIAACRDRLVMCRWDRHAVTTYRLQPRGASFSAEEETLVTGTNNARPVGVGVGQGGRLFVTALYMAGNMASPYCYSDLVVVKRTDESKPPTYQPFEITKISDEQLQQKLATDSWEQRYRCEQEIMRRGGKPSARPGAAAVNTSGELATMNPTDQLAALIRYIDGEQPPSWDEVVRLATSDDTYLRQTALTCLARRADHRLFSSAYAARDANTRRAAIAATGLRLTVPASNSIPPAEIPLSFPKENAFFKTKLYFWGETQPVELAEEKRIGSYTAAQSWAATKHSDEQEELFSLLSRALDDTTPAVRLDAAYYLGLLRDARTEPRIDATKRDVVIQRLLKTNEQSVEQVWTIGPFDDGNGTPRKSHPPELGVIDLTAKYAQADGELAWQQTAARQQHLQFGNANKSTSPTSTYAHFQLQSGIRQPALVAIQGIAAVQLWQNGTAVTGETLLTAAPASRWLLDLQPGSNDLLVRLPTNGEVRVSIRIQSAMPVAVVLPEPLDSKLLAERLKAATTSDTAALSKEFLDVNWIEESTRGDASQGRKLFGTLACAKCHAITAEQKGAGAPSLTEAKRRFTVPHLVESILLPSKQVAEPFRATHLITDGGQTLTGLVTAEAADSVELLLPDASRRTILKSMIEERKTSTLSPMPHGLVKTPQELRDLLAYLISDRPLPP